MTSLLISIGLLVAVVAPLLAWVFREDRRRRAPTGEKEEVA